MQSTLPDREIVLWGIGHTNAHVLRMWRMHPIPRTRLTCVSDRWISTYSGMLPGVLAGQYPRERMELDLVRLCASAGARLIRADVSGLDVPGRRLLFDDRPPLPFDALSIGIGSVPSQEGVEIVGASLVPVKPMPTFLDRIRERLLRVRSGTGGSEIRLVVVGGGAGGVEIVFCLPAFVRRTLNDARLSVSLIQAGEQLNAGTLASTNERIRKELEARGVRLHLGQRVTRVCNEFVTLSTGERIEADVVVWATGATAPPILRTLGLPIDDNGFLLTRPTLQTVAEAPIFVVGDSGTIRDSPTPKAGVYAVREGPYLWKNFAHVLDGAPLEPYRPQKSFLKLLNMGDGRAIGEYAGRSFQGRWCWRLKDFIDRRFIDKFQDYRPMEAAANEPAPAASVMRCAGCGGKIGGAILSNVLQRLDVKAGPGVLVGLDAPDDAAIIQPLDGGPLALTIDFFAAPLDDPYVVGRLAALHSASDAWAMNAMPRWALAMATIPLGRPRPQEQLLYECLAGSLHEFQKMGVSLVGGHTIEGPQFTVGFTVLAGGERDGYRTKGGFREGDRLVLTKPLGTGILLAAQMRALCRAEWMDTLLAAMLVSNREAASLIDEFDIRGLTDITGFGLAGHLLEAIRAGRLDAELAIDDVPILPGVAELVGQGIESTLAPANRTAEAWIESRDDQRKQARYAAMFDPQTCGGLLLGVPESHVDAVLARLEGRGTVVGVLRARRGEEPTIRLV